MGKLAKPGIATALAVFVLVSLVAAVAMALATHPGHGLDVEGVIGLVLLTVPYTVVGLVIARRQPGNALGWLLLGAPSFDLLSTVAGQYELLDYQHHHGQLPLGALAVVLQPSWAPAIVCMVLAFLLFPDARLPLGRWRWMLWPFLTLASLWMLGAYVIAAANAAGHSVVLDSGGNLQALNHPTGAAAPWGILQDVFFPVFLLSLLGSLARQVMSFRASTGERRLQLKWLLSGAVVCMVAWYVSVSLPESSPILRALSNVATAGLAALPISIGIAILKYRLFEIDRVISRALSYAVVTGLLVGVYVGLITLTTRALPLSSPIGVAASTLAAAALFTPLRRRTQRIVDRRFNRARYDADATIAAFSIGLRDAVDLERVQLELLDAVRRSVQPSQASIWIRGRGSVETWG